MPNIKNIQGKKMQLEPLENPIVIHPHLLQRFLKQGKNYANLFSLVQFLPLSRSTAKDQPTPRNR